MTNDCICSNVPRIWRLAGVTRTVRLTVTKDGSPYDFTGLQTVLRIDRDNSDFHYEPQFTVEGDDNNIIVFTWAADKQPLGDYTIEVTVTDGSGNKDRVNWHGATGVRLVEYSNLVKGEDAAGVESDSELGLDGIFTMNGVGMDAYEEWLADGNEGSLHDYILWMQGPAREAAEAAETTMTEIQSRADDDHTTAGSDHTRAAADHTTATGDHTRAEEDHTRAISDHTRAAQDHTSAVGDHMTAGQDHLRAEADHTTASTDHTRAESDHSTAASDHTTAASDHTKAGQDSTRAGNDHDIAVADHAQAEADHTRAEGDHTTAAADHTTAAADHTQAASDHTTAAADHTQAVADHAVMAGYDTRLTNVETDVTQLGQYIDSPEWIRVITDADDRVVWGIDLSGNVIDNTVYIIEDLEARMLIVEDVSSDAVPKTDIADDLTTNDSTKVLSAKQGKALNDNKLNNDDVVNNLETDDPTKPLSAAQGAQLNTKVSELGVYISSPEYVRVITDADDRVLWAIDVNGNVVDFTNGDDEIEELEARIAEIEEAIDFFDGESIPLAFIDTTLESVSSNISPGEYGLVYSKPYPSLIYKTANGIQQTADLSVITAKTYLYGTVYLNLVYDAQYDSPYVLVERRPEGKAINRFDGCNLQFLSEMPDYSAESWDWAKQDGQYTMMQQVYAYLDALCLQYPKLITKYDPMATESYQDGGVTVNTLPNILSYMTEHGYSEYPFWYNGCEDGDYDVVVGSNTYHAHIKATPYFRTFVYKISQPEWYVFKPQTRRLRKRIMYIQGGIHGSENMGPFAAAHMAKELLSGSESALKVLGTFDVYIIPALDGYNCIHGDYDGAYGTNANRNYPTPWWRDNSPESKPNQSGRVAGDYFVTRLSCAFMDTYNPSVAFDLHDQTPAVINLGQCCTGFSRTTTDLYQSLLSSYATIAKTSRFEQYYGTCYDIPQWMMKVELMNAAHTHDYFFYKNIRCAALLELPGGINRVALPDGSSEYQRVVANDYSPDTCALALLLANNAMYEMCMYNLNNY